MAATHVQAAQQYSGTVFSGDGTGVLAFPAQLTVGNTVIVAFGLDASSRTVTSVTDDGGNTYALASQGGVNATGEIVGTLEAWIYVCNNVTSVAQTITVTLSSAAAADASMVIVEVAGAADTPIQDVIATVQSSTTTTHNLGDADVSAGSYAFGYMFMSAGTWTLDSDFTSLQNASKALAGYDEVAAGPTHNMTNSSSGLENGVYLYITLSPAAAGNAYTLTAEQGSYTLTGQAANLLAGSTMTAEHGTYSLIGSEALRDISMSAEAGSYALNGQDATLAATARFLTAETGSYSLTGQAANLLYSAIATIVRSLLDKHIGLGLFR